MLATIGLLSLLLTADPPAPAAAAPAAKKAAAKVPAAKQPPEAVKEPAPENIAPAAPYQVLVCLRAASHPILTPLFVESVRRQVQDQLANFFGPLASVEVRSSGHWLIDDFRDEPVEESSLTPAELATRRLREKAFLVGLDFQDSVYRLTWQALDGTVLQIGPLRTQTTPDRQWVAKAVCLAVKGDFAPVADVKPGSAGGVILTFRGSEHRSQLTKLLAEESIWQPYAISRKNGVVQRRPMKYTVLRIERDRLGEPQVVSTADNAFSQRAAITGIEAVKLSTCTGRLRLRLINKDTGAPVINCSVAANDTGFDSLTDADQLPPPDREGYVESQRTYKHLAYIKISTGGVIRTRFPLPITSQRCDFDVPITADKRASEKNDFERMLRALNQDLHLIDVFQSDTVRQFNTHNASKRYEEALQLVAAGVESIQPNLQTAKDHLTTLKRLARDLELTASAALEAADKQFVQIEKRTTELLDLRTTLQQAMDTRQAQDRANVLIKLGQQAEQEGNIEEAIARYELALGERPDQPPLQAKLARLKQLWEQKSPARDLVYERWAKAEVTEIAALLPEVEKTLPALIAAGDYLTLQKLVLVNGAQASELSALVEQISATEGAAEKAEAEKYSDLAQRIATFQEKVAAAFEQVQAAESSADAAEPASPEPPPPAAAPAKAAAPSNAPPPSAEEEPPLK